MDTRSIGSLKVSVVGLGCNNFGMRLDYDGSTRVIDAAIDAGINFFDTADIYGGTHSEEFLGRALAGRREHVILATKFGIPIDEARRGGAKPEYIRRALDDSLRRLGTDRIDLYQIHQPDPSTPIADTLGALADLVREGKVREIGCSNFSAAQLAGTQDAVVSVGAHFVSVQNEYSLLHREPEHAVLAECETLGIAFIPYFPLASGLLAGKGTGGATPPANSRLSGGWAATRFLTVDRVKAANALRSFAESRGHTLLDLAMSWLLRHGVVSSVIAGATTPEQVRDNVRAATAWRLTPIELAEIDQLAPAT
jgi:aryl-alcohol dehydrogenase-like predicted oxidoreductase